MSVMEKRFLGSAIQHCTYIHTTIYIYELIWRQIGEASLKVLTRVRVRLMLKSIASIPCLRGAGRWDGTHIIF